MMFRRVGTTAARRAVSSLSRKHNAAPFASSLTNYILTSSNEQRNGFEFCSLRSFGSKPLAMPVRVVEVSFRRRLP